MEINVNQFFPFALDNFQKEAISYLEAGNSVVVSAPTGAGKTAIAEYAIELALFMNKRCFYTTPLKALSNQKFHDFCLKYGSQKIGLLTGDISINRDATVVVMTTEVFRNMLYGTSLGDISKNVKGVAFVILDECHYMNDAERGTVWEESIIYCPPDIQLVALSATVANAGELTAWIEQTHGTTKFVMSDVRPVPLRFYYFGANRLFPLFSFGQKLNHQLKLTFGSKNKQNRPRKHQRRKIEDVPHPKHVLQEMLAKNLLPVIYFLFSRRGCEEALLKAEGLRLVNDLERSLLKESIEQLVGNNPNLKDHPHLRYLYQGMAVHHAGMLPSWKALIEKLFQKGLLKVVFATETLAAGINMPARSTIVSAISKRTDTGHRILAANEFLQMSGRAGRRGMDTTGYVVVLNHPFEAVEDVARLAASPPDPLESHFTPSYGMVLNLLQRYTPVQAKDLIERSFGQFLIEREIEPWFLKKMNMEHELERLSQPLCPGELGDLPRYQRYLETCKTKSKQVKHMERGLAKIKSQEENDIFEGLRSETISLLKQAYAMPCHGCPVQKPCSKQADRIDLISERIKELTRRIDKATNCYWQTFEALSNILRLKGYINGDTPTHLGCMAAAIRGTNELFLCEVLISGIFENLTPSECAAVLTALVSEESYTDRTRHTLKATRLSPTNNVNAALEQIQKIGHKITRLQRDFDVEVLVDFSSACAPLSELWAQGASWEDIRFTTDLDEGDVVRILRRTVDLCRQFIKAPFVPDKLVDLLASTYACLARDEVKETL